VSEVHFTEQNYEKIPTYTTYSSNHPDGKTYAGSAVIIREDKNHELSKYEREHIQATIINIEDWDGN
jgi:hypothetical protein